MGLNVMHELHESVHILSKRYRETANGQVVHGCLQIVHKLAHIRFD
jgi:hypothetical protein